MIHPTRWPAEYIRLVQRFINAAEPAVNGDEFDTYEYDNSKAELLNAMMGVGGDEGESFEQAAWNEIKARNGRDHTEEDPDYAETQEQTNDQ